MISLVQRLLRQHRLAPIIAIVYCLVFQSPVFSQAEAPTNENSSFHPLGEWRQITSKFGYRKNPFGGGKRQFHRGIDLAIQVGDSVFAWRTGVVSYTGYNKISGNVVNVLHADGYTSKYHHLLRILVEEGEVVDAGQYIGKAGKSGRVTGPHLHFTLMKEEKFLDPLPFLKKSSRVGPAQNRKPTNVQRVQKEMLFRSTPFEGDLYINGEFRGKTPQSLKLDYGQHFIEIDGGRGYQSVRERIEVNQHSDRIYAATLSRRVREEAAEADLDYGSPSLGRINGLLTSLNVLTPSSPEFQGITRRNFGFDIGLGGFFDVTPILFTDQFVEVKLSMSFGSFEEDQLYYNRSIGGNTTRTESLDYYRVIAGAVGYYLSPRLSQRFNLLFGSEIAVGSWRVRTRSVNEGREPVSGDVTEAYDYRFNYLAPAVVIGGLVQINDHLAASLKFQQTVLATETGWSGYKIGLITGFKR